MKIVIGRDALFEGLQNVGAVIPQKPTVPVLSNFLLRTEGENLFISGTDMDMYVTTSVKCTVEGEGSVTVNAKRFLSMIRELPSEDITIESEFDRITVNFRLGESSVLGMPSSDYPALREVVDGIRVTLAGSDFVEMVEKTSFSVASERTRIALTGVYWDVSSEAMIMVSTDGHRLSMFEKKVSPGFRGETGDAVQNHMDVIVPPKVLSHASRVVMGEQEPGKLFFDVVFGQGAILFDFGATKIFSKLIEGPYPDFRRVIPSGNSKHVFVNTDELAGTVRRVSVLSNSVTHQIKISVSSGVMEVSTSNVDIGGEARETVRVRYEGESLTVGYNAQFLSEILRAVDTEEIEMELEAPTSACIVRPGVRRDDQEYFYLIMPLRLNE